MPENLDRSAFRLVFGVGLVAAGVLFTMSNLGLAEADSFLRWWPMLIVLYGLMRVIGIWCRPSVWSGVLFMLFGAWWLLHNLDLLSIDVWQFWPIVFILMGIGIMRRGRWGKYIGGIGVVGISRRRRRWAEEAARAAANRVVSGAVGGSMGGAPAGGATGETPPESSGESGEPWWRRKRESEYEVMGPGHRASETDGMLRVDVFLSSVVRKVGSQSLKGGDIVAVLGGAEVDLRSAKLEGDGARIEINLVMGGVTLYVPDNWVVEFHGTPIMGGFEDQSRPPAGEVRGRLILSGVVLLSGIVVKN